MGTANSLVRVDPRTVIVDHSLLKPTGWDQRVVPDDLRQYVSRSRLVPGTPVLRLRRGQLFVVSGLPFLAAARDAVPPLSEVVCEVVAKPHELQQANLRVVSVSSLLDDMPPDELYRATNMLFFRRALNAQEQKAVEGMIVAFFQEATSPEWKYGGQYRWMENPEWNEAHDMITWTWWKSDTEGHDLLRLSQVLREVDTHIAPIRSYNGFVPLFP